MADRSLALGSLALLMACASPLARSPEANAELKRLVSEYGGKGYPHWQRAITTNQPDIHLDFRGPSGVNYQADIHPVWDGDENGVIRVIVCVDDRGASAYRPLCDSALLAPTGAP
jgi:hypothetical protein